MQVPREAIYFEGKTRLREDYGDLRELAKSLGVRGQLQPVLVKPFDPEEDPEVEDDFQWKLVDGGRRFLAFEIAERSEIEIPGVESGCIEIYTQQHDDPLKALEAEYHANEDRKDFNWREKAMYIKRIHEAHVDRDSDWGVPKTANLLDMGNDTVYKYLQVTEPKYFNHDELESADSFRTAYKKYRILKDHDERRRLAAARKEARKRLKEKADEDGDSTSTSTSSTSSDDTSDESFDYSETGEMAREVVTQADCVEWFGTVDDEEFDWVHWDPPYGENQKGGAFSTHKGIEDNWHVASKLMRATIPEIWRTLRNGRWLAIWCHPTRTNWLATYLRGHERSDSYPGCKHCGKPWRPHKIAGPCYKNPTWRFWVNKYPNIWYKTNREADGHEIKRFGVNAYETFLLAAKVEEKDDDPILVRSDWKNVFPYEGVISAERRHVMHKPAELLTEILSIISVRGSFGCDPSAGSGSIIEAALGTDRRLNAVEIDEDYANVCREVAETVMERRGIVSL